MAVGAPILLSCLLSEEQKMKKSGASLVEKEVHGNMVSPKYNTEAITACNM